MHWRVGFACSPLACLSLGHTIDVDKSLELSQNELIAAITCAPIFCWMSVWTTYL